MPALLASASDVSPVTASASATCAHCGRRFEFRAGEGRLEPGGSRRAGALQFEGMMTTRVPKLRVDDDRSGVAFHLQGAAFRLPAPPRGPTPDRHGETA